MRVTIKKELFEAAGAAAMRRFGLTTDHYRWHGDDNVDLRRYKVSDIVDLIEAFEPHEKTVKGTRAVVADCRVWLKALDGDGVRPRKIEQFADIAREWCRKIPRHLLYCEESGVWLPYLVNGVQYHHPNDYPAYVTVSVIYQRLGKTKEKSLHFGWDDVQGVTCKEAFANEGYFPETAEMRTDHEAALERYGDLHAKVGLQVLGRGTAEELSSRDEWWWRQTNDVLLERDGQPARMVVDVFREDDRAEGRNREASLSGIWRGDPDDDEDAPEIEGVEPVLVPIHPHVVCFDLKRHMRLVVHVGNLDVYEYDRSLDAKLVLPEPTTRLVKMLLSSTAEFKDVIGNKSGGVVILCAGPPGTGKCLGYGTPVLLHTGHVKPVQSVCVGDALMGPDSEPRIVRSVTTGVGPLYRVVPKKGKPWVCNDVHILTLVHSVTGEVVDVPLDEYVRMPASKKHHLKLYQPDGGVEFERSFDERGPYAVDPYFLGVWLGDGTKALDGVAVSKPDAEIEAACRDEAKRFGLHVRTSDTGSCPTYHVVGGQRGGAANPLLDCLRDLMRDGVRVPGPYLHGPRDVRAAVLAGIVDTDGHLTCNCWDVVQKNAGLAADIAFLARSLGLRATERVKVVNGEEYQRISISGECGVVPTRITRKTPHPRRQKKNALRTGFRVEPIGDGDYYGFTLDGDGRFLLGDFTVTHNTLTAEVYAESMARPLYSVQCSQLGTNPDDLEKNLLVIFARAQRWNAILLLDEADVYVMTRGHDLDQNAIVGVFLRTLEYYRGVLFMTTNRSDLVDDAVASRCVARVDYAAPGPELLWRIWEVLALSAGIILPKRVIDEAVKRWPDIVGRDVKNMLKLAMMMSVESGKPVDVATLEYVRQFKPTQASKVGN